MSHNIFRWFVSLMLGLAMTLAPTSVVFAMGFTVNSTADAVDANPGDGICASATGECTLRAAIQEANALPGDDTITLPSGTYTLAINGVNEDASATGDLDITSNLEINGAGASNTIVDGNSSILNDRVFHIPAFFTVKIFGVTVQNGDLGSSDIGGGISNSGALTLTDSKVINNRAWDGGGLINSPTGILHLNNSIVSGNSAQFGAGIFQGPDFQPTQVSGTLILTNSVVSNNTGLLGSGIANSSGIVTLDKSTVSNNTGGGTTIFNFNNGILTLNNSTISNNNSSDIAGIRNDSGTVTLNNSTISNNTGGRFGGIYNQGTVNLKNTILAGNFGGSFPDCSGTMASQGYNLIGNTTGCIISGDTTGNLTNIDPLLSPLQDNGGPTFTHALLPGSPAIDAGNPAGCTDQNGNLLTTDQRGVARPQGSRCDIGAFELEASGGGNEALIDIKPGSASNPINLKSKGNIPVAILSAADFNAPSMVDKTSLTFGSTGDEHSLASCSKSGQDVNGDGLLDQVCYFKTQLTAFQVGNTEGILKGLTRNGISLEGSDSVRILK